MSKLIFNEKIYTYQIDYVGHVNNIIYIQWMENGRVKLLEAMGMPAHEIAHTEEIFPILVETNIKYKRPLFLNNTVTIEGWVSALNNASAIIEFRFFNEKSELCATGSQKGLFIDRKTNRPARLTENHRKAFEKYLVKN
ncbi:MAG TPA: thioesterase family protein [Draconibacterium sp.]|nr:thioesterase family protein [Draconibacterium sp.]